MLNKSSKFTMTFVLMIALLNLAESKRVFPLYCKAPGNEARTFVTPFILAALVYGIPD